MWPGHSVCGDSHPRHSDTPLDTKETKLRAQIGSAGAKTLRFDAACPVIASNANFRISSFQKQWKGDQPSQGAYLPRQESLETNHVPLLIRRNLFVEKSFFVKICPWKNHSFESLLWILRDREESGDEQTRTSLRCALLRCGTAAVGLECTQVRRDRHQESEDNGLIVSGP